MNTTLALKRSLGISMAIAVAATALIAFAQTTYAGTTTVTSENKNTGHKSVNRNINKSRKSSRKRVRNRARTQNSVSLYGDTGANVVKHNTNATGSLKTGNVKADVKLTNKSNGSSDPELFCLNDGGSSVDSTQSNSNTGSKSKNVNKTSVTERSKCSVSNTAQTRNRVNITGYTGGNTVKGNTKVGNTTTGNVSLNLSISNTAN